MEKKKILVICQHFWPEEFRINDICKSLVDKGLEVDVICGIPNYPEGVFYNGFSLFRKRKENFDGINVYRSFLIPRGKGNPFQVFMNYISFPIFSIFQLWKVRKRDYDKIFVYQLTPVFMALPAILAKKLFRKEIYIYILDLWPESLYSVYNFKSKIYKKLFDKISDLIYKKFDYYLTTSKGIKEKIEDKYGIDPTKILYLPNWAEDLYETKKDNIELNQRYKNTFNIMFAGNIGPAQGFEMIIKAAKKCRDDGFNNIKWLIVGDGISKKWAEEKARGLNDTVEFLGRQPISRMPEYYNVADVMLVSLVKSELFRITLPAKIQSYMVSGKPILASIDGEGAEIIEESQAGIVSASEDYICLAENAKKMSLLSEDELTKMGKHAREYYLNNFQKESLSNKLINFLFSQVLSE